MIVSDAAWFASSIEHDAQVAKKLENQRVV
jgi:hypothetical protein